jgi:phosphatidylserine/phosphatidylglycerophosphate/cardiolipin synthase-like enzyme
VAGRSGEPRPRPHPDAPSAQPSPEVVATVPQVELPAQIRAGRLPLTWAPATVIVDQPSKIASEGNPDQDETLADDVVEIAQAAKTELVLISPYFVPGKRGVALLKSLRDRGVNVRILTNSLAATDAALVHTGYARYREDLLRMGVELYELRARPGGDMRTKWGGSSGSGSGSSASLHVKAVVIDGRLLLVGSMNLDPRSAYLNTELMLAVRSTPLAQRTVELYREAARSGSWRVTWETGEGMVWTAPDGQRETTEPDAPLWLRALIKVLGPLAPEEML